MGLFDKFTERARKVLQLAQEEAQRFNHDHIGTEHLLLGLVREGDGVGARVLNNMGVRLPDVRSAVEFIIGRGKGDLIVEIGLTPRAKKVLELAIDESARLNHDYVGTEHLLLGLLREGEGIAAGVLESVGVSLEKVRAQVMKALSGTALPFTQGGPPGDDPRIDDIHPRTLIILARAVEEAVRRRHARVGIAHLLWALFRDETGPLARIATESGTQLPDLESRIATALEGAETSDSGYPALSSTITIILRLSNNRPQGRGRMRLSPEHILDSLTRPEILAATSFANTAGPTEAGVIDDAELLISMESTWAEIRRLLDAFSADSQDQDNSDSPP